MHFAAKLLERPRVVDVATRRNVIHAEVLQHVMRHLGCVGFAEAETSEDVFGEVGAALGVMFAAAVLADIVQERGEEERMGTRNFGRQPARKGVLAREIAAAERAQQIDRRYRVNVDRVHVINVVMNAAHDRKKFRNHCDDEPDVV